MADNTVADLGKLLGKLNISNHVGELPRNNNMLVEFVQFLQKKIHIKDVGAEARTLLQHFHCAQNKQCSKSESCTYQKSCIFAHTPQTPDEKLQHYMTCSKLILYSKAIDQGIIQHQVADYFCARVAKLCLRDKDLVSSIAQGVLARISGTDNSTHRNSPMINLLTFMALETSQITSPINAGRKWDSVDSMLLSLVVAQQSNIVRQKYCGMGTSCKNPFCLYYHVDDCIDDKTEKNLQKQSFEYLVRFIALQHPRFKNNDDKHRNKLDSWVQRVLHSASRKPTDRLRVECRRNIIKELATLVLFHHESVSDSTSGDDSIFLRKFSRHALKHFRERNNVFTTFDVDSFSFKSVQEKEALRFAVEYGDNPHFSLDRPIWNEHIDNKAYRLTDLKNEPFKEILREIYASKNEEDESSSSERDSHPDPAHNTPFLILYLIKHVGEERLVMKLREKGVYGFKDKRGTQKQMEMVKVWSDNYVNILKEFHPIMCSKLAGFVDWAGEALHLMHKLARCFGNLILVEEEEEEEGGKEAQEIDNDEAKLSNLQLDWRLDCCKPMAKKTTERLLKLVLSYLLCISNQLSHQDPDCSPQLFFVMSHKLLDMFSNKRKDGYEYINTKKKICIPKQSGKHIRKSFQALRDEIQSKIPERLKKKLAMLCA